VSELDGYEKRLTVYAITCQKLFSDLVHAL